MESKTKFLGHPVHPMLIVFPLGLFVATVIFDIIYLISGETSYPTIAYYDMLVGIIGGLIAAVFGFRDWLAVPAGTRAKSIGAMHGIGNVTIVALFLISWFMRMNNPLFIPSTLAFFLSLLGVILAAFTGWLGGELVDQLGVGVNQNANINAPSSLSNQATSMPVEGMHEMPVTGADKYREKHIEKGLNQEVDTPVNTRPVGDEMGNGTDYGSDKEHDNLD